MARRFSLISVVFLAVLLSPVGSIAALQSTSAQSSSLAVTMHQPIPSQESSKKAFAFVSNFESLTLEGWSGVQGTNPVVVYSPNYSGEPSLLSSTSGGDQVDYADRGFVKGLTSLSFQVALHSPSGSAGFFGLASSSSNTSFVAVVGVANGNVVAGPNASNLSIVEPVPKGTAYPSGWVYLLADVSQNGRSWTMQVFVDRTDQVAVNVSVPGAVSYSGAMIETVKGEVCYTNIIVSTYFMATVIPGYNNMQGYGQGSALLVKLLPAYDNLTAEMTLNSWSAPQDNILSFQINAMNLTGTTKSTCHGFFQLGVDINQNGYIAPWYVPGINCEAHYSWPSQGGGPGLKGIPSPFGTQLELSIIFQPGNDSILFKIVDASTSQVFEKYIAYYGGAFYGTYTQMEFQPCCNSHPIGDYRLQGQLSGMQITTAKGPESLPASYMLPFNLDTPPSWDLSFYQNGTAGYSETSR